jgi:hypothetical protein
VPFRGTPETELDRLKNRLLKQLLDQTEDPSFMRPCAAPPRKRPGWPGLPLSRSSSSRALLEEKARGVQQQGARQHYIRQRSQNLLENAVA